MPDPAIFDDHRQPFEQGEPTRFKHWQAKGLRQRK